MVSVNLCDVLKVCACGALAAQRYIALELLHINSPDTHVPSDIPVMRLDTPSRNLLLAALHRSVSIDVKGTLIHKSGSASQDLVTTADVVVQTVLESMLRTAFPDVPFTIVGEEASANDSETRTAAERCVAMYGCAPASIPCVAALDAAAVAAPMIVSAATPEELRARVGVFIDPIDGTNCFVEGCWDAPMTLAGITLDGVPVAAIANRLFALSAAQAAGEVPCESLSLVWGAGEPLVVLNGRVAVPRKARVAAQEESVLRVACSGTTKDTFYADSLAMMKPAEPYVARGAGNKLMRVVASALDGEEEEEATACDAFLCPDRTIRKWDTCAPHAFLRALGGEVRTKRGEPVLYSLSAAPEVVTEIPGDIVAASAWALDEMARRMQCKEVLLLNKATLMTGDQKSGPEVLRLRFAEAAKHLTELYRDASRTYDRGYRDAMLHVCRFIALSSGRSPSVESDRLLRFAQGALRHRDSIGAARASGRRRKRSASTAEECRRTRVEGGEAVWDMLNDIRISPPGEEENSADAGTSDEDSGVDQA